MVTRHQRSAPAAENDDVPAQPAPPRQREALRVARFTSLAACAHLRDDVDALNRASPRRCPFSTFAFYERYVAHNEYFPPGTLQVLFLAVFDGPSLVAYLALRRIAEVLVPGIKRPKIELLVTHDNERPHLVCRADDEEHAARAIYAHLLAHEDFTFLELSGQEPSSWLARLLAAQASRHIHTRRMPVIPTAIVPVTAPSLDAYFHALQKKMRSNTSRQARRLFAAGDVVAVHSDDPVALPALFELYLRVEGGSWKAKAHAGIARHPERLRFFEAFVRGLDPMRPSLTVFFVDGTPVAGILNGHYEGAMYALEMAYDDAWAERGPGQMLLLFSMHEAIERRARSYNLLTSFAYYKARWGAHIVDAEALQLFRVGSFHFYKAIFGDFRRRVLEGIVPSEAEARRAYNATRRKVEPPHDDEALHAPSDALAALRARGEGLRFWSKDALAALLPFKTT